MVICAAERRRVMHLFLLRGHSSPLFAFDVRRAVGLSSLYCTLYLMRHRHAFRCEMYHHDHRAHPSCVRMYLRKLKVCGAYSVLICDIHAQIDIQIHMDMDVGVSVCALSSIDGH